MEPIINNVKAEFGKVISFLNKSSQISLEELRKELNTLHDLLYQLAESENDLDKKHEAIYSLMYVDSINDQLDYAVPETIIPFAKEQIKHAIEHFNNYTS